VSAAGALKKNAKDIDSDLTEEEKQNLVKVNPLLSAFPVSRASVPSEQGLTRTCTRQAGLGALAVVAVGIIAFVASRHDKCVTVTPTLLSRIPTALLLRLEAAHECGRLIADTPADVPTLVAQEQRGEGRGVYAANGEQCLCALI